MRFSDTDNYNGILQDIETRLQLGVGGITDSTKRKKEFTRLVNNRYHEAVTIWLESQDEWDFDDDNRSDYPVATRSLVAGQRDYQLPTAPDVLKLKRLDVTYDGSNYYKGVPVDSLEFQFAVGNDSDVDGHFDRSNPHYDVKANHIWLYPRANSDDVSAGAQMRAEYYRTVEEFSHTDTSKEPSLPKSFQTYLSIGAALDYAVSRSLQAKDDLSQLLTQKEQWMRNFAYDQNEDRQITPTPYISNDYGK